MLTIDGYYPMQSFYRRAKGLISRRMWKHFQALNDMMLEDSNEEGDEPLRRARRAEYWNESIEIGAQFLVYDLISRADKGVGKVHVLRPGGSLTTASLEITEPLAHLFEKQGGYASHRSGQVSDGLVSRREMLFGLDTFKLEFWPEYFVRDRIFTQTELEYKWLAHAGRRHLPILNWKLCSIDLTFLKAVADAKVHLDAAYALLDSVGCRPPVSIARLREKETDIPALLRMFEPFDGCPIVLPEKLWSSFDELEASNAGNGVWSEKIGTPIEAIIAILDSEGSIGKTSIRARISELFQGVSSRQFDRYWDVVAADRPEVKRPGRKSTRRIKTEF